MAFSTLGARLKMLYGSGLSTPGSTTTWTDDKGLGGNLTQATSGKQPTIQTAGNGSDKELLFDGSNDFVNGNPTQTIAAGNATAHVLFFYFKSTGSTGADQVLWHEYNTSTTDQYQVFIRNSDGKICVTPVSAGSVSSSNSSIVGDGNFHTVMVYFNRLSGDTCTIYLDGVAQTTTGGSGGNDSFVGNTTFIGINRNGTSSPFKGVIGQIGYAHNTSAFSAGDFASIHSDLVTIYTYVPPPVIIETSGPTVTIRPNYLVDEQTDSWFDENTLFQLDQDEDAPSPPPTFEGAVTDLYGDLCYHWWFQNFTSPRVDGYVNYKSKGSAVSDATNIFAFYPTGISAGDLLLLALTFKPGAGTVTVAPSGWTDLGSIGGGSGVDDIDSGNVNVKLYFKYADGTELDSDGANVIISSLTGACIIGQIFCFGTTDGYTYTYPVVASGSTASISTTFQVNTGSPIYGLPTDVWVGVVGSNSQTRTFSSPVITSPDVTFNAESLLDQTATASGNGATLVVSRHNIATGIDPTSTPTISLTASGSSTDEPAGAAQIVRMRAITSQVGWKDEINSANLVQFENSNYPTSTNSTPAGILAVPFGSDTYGFQCVSLYPPPDGTNTMQFSLGEISLGSTVKSFFVSMMNADSSALMVFGVDRDGSDNSISLSFYRIGGSISVDLDNMTDPDMTKGSRTYTFEILSDDTINIYQNGSIIATGTISGAHSEIARIRTWSIFGTDTELCSPCVAYDSAGFFDDGSAATSIDSIIKQYIESVAFDPFGMAGFFGI